MASFKGSGVYATITDESQSAGSAGQGASCIVPMKTKRGNAFEVVTYQTFEDLVGLDLAYNAGYLGLQTLLQTMAQVTVMRLNKDALVGNALFLQSGRTMSLTGLSDPYGIPSAVLAVKEEAVVVTTTVTKTFTPYILAGSVKVYDAGTTTLLAHDDGAGVIVADAASGVAGTVVYGPTPSVTLTYTGTKTVDIVYTPNEVPSLGIAMNSAGDWGTLGVVSTPATQTIDVARAASVSCGVPIQASSLKIYSSGVLVAHDNAGTLVADNGSAVAGTVVAGTGVVTFTTQPTGNLLTLTFVPATVTVHTLSVYKQVDLVWTLLESQNYSMSSAASNFIGKLTWQNVIVTYLAAYGVSSTFGSAGTPVALNGADDGAIQLPSEIDTTSLDGRSETFLVMNGLNQSYANTFLAYANNKDVKHVIVDAPAFGTYDETASWALGLQATNRAGLYAVPDYVVTEIGELPIYPSIKVMLAYSNMFTKTGTLKYPVAGYIYGSTTATKLLTTDFSAHAADLKSRKINYVKIGPQGPVIWEERSLYGGESDLSYCYVTFILDDIKAQLVSYMSSFVFKLIGATDLVRIQSGIDHILETEINAGFLYSAKAEVPSFAQVQQSGIRQATIPVTVQVAQDGEEWTFDIVVSNVAVA